MKFYNVGSFIYGFAYTMMFSLEGWHEPSCTAAVNASARRGQQHAALIGPYGRELTTVCL